MSPEVKGWCPGALRPMAAGDGLIVRLRLPMGRMTPDQARGIAQAAQAHGNGQMGLSGRGNLQLRGVSAAGHQGLLADLAALGVLDPDLETEARRNITVSPFWTPGDGTETLVAELTARLAELPELPAKFGHVIDTGPQRHLAQVPGDLRLERAAAGGLILRADGAANGQPVDVQNAVSALIETAHWFVQQGGAVSGRGRMRALIGAGLIPPLASAAPAPARAAPLPGPQAPGYLAAFEFGALEAGTLLALAALDLGLRLTPWRMILVEGISAAGPLAGIPGLILDPAAPALRVRACPGAPLCPQGLGPTFDLARALAPLVPAGQVLHVSGCAKGCAHPLPADIVLRAGTGGFALGWAARAEEVQGPALSAADLLRRTSLLPGKEA